MSLKTTVLAGASVALAAIGSPALAASTTASASASASLRGTGATDSHSDSQTFSSAGPVSAASASADMSNRVFQNSGENNPINSHATAYADLASGVLRATASGNCANTYDLGGRTFCFAEGTGQASAGFGDTFTFTPGSATSFAQVSFVIDGLIADPVTAPNDLNLVSAALSLYGVFPNGSHSNSFYAIFSAAQPAQYSGGWIDPVINSSVVTGVGGVRSYAWSFTGFLPLASFTSYVGGPQLNVLGRDGGYVDFGNTARLSFNIAPDVTFSSGAGNFAAVNVIGAGAPEPAAWTMLIAGFATMGSAMRRRRARA